jgi:hypothetical protein
MVSFGIPRSSQLDLIESGRKGCWCGLRRSWSREDALVRGITSQSVRGIKQIELWRSACKRSSGRGRKPSLHLQRKCLMAEWGRGGGRGGRCRGWRLHGFFPKQFPLYNHFFYLGYRFDPYMQHGVSLGLPEGHIRGDQL